MKIIGITGKSGSGKTTFASLLAKKLKCQHIDIDKIGHEAIYRPSVSDILCKKFGPEILDENGKPNRKKIGNIVFGQKQKMEELTDITWDFMQHQLDTILSQKNEILVLDWILLPNSKYWDKCDCKILVISDNEKRKNKVMERDNISKEYFEKRDSASIDYSKINFNYIFENDYQEQTMVEMITRISKQYIVGNEKPI